MSTEMTPSNFSVAAQGTLSDEPHDPLKAAIWQALLPFREELLSTGGVTFMGLRNAVAKAVVLHLTQQPTETGDLDRPATHADRR